MGGNLFNISSPSGFKDINELHALWDSAVYKEHKSNKTPFNSDDWLQFVNDISGLIQTYEPYIK